MTGQVTLTPERPTSNSQLPKEARVGHADGRILRTLTLGHVADAALLAGRPAACTWFSLAICEAVAHGKACASRRCRMADEKPMPETLETIADKIVALGKSIDERFAKVDQQFAETRAQVGVKIEAVDEKVTRVYDAVIAVEGHKQSNDKAHVRFNKRLDDHDVRILALEPAKP